MSGLNSMLRSLLRAVGKQYEPAPDLPSGLIVHTFRKRSVALCRGLVRLRSRAFLESRVVLRGKPGISVGRFATLERGVLVDGYATRGVRIGSRTKIGACTVISCTSHLSKLGVGFEIGHDCGIGEFGYFGAAGGITIGNDVIMGQFVSFHSEEHRFADPGATIRSQGVVSKGIRIGDDVWVGAKATFLDGCEVGGHSVVAAGSVVRGRFPPHSLIAGTPARLIRSLEGSDP